MADIICDVLVIGGSLGGVAAALSAARSGKDVLLLSASNWIGGQMTSQGVCTPDENQFVETSGSTRTYRNFRQRTRQYYETNFMLSAAGKASIVDHGYLELGESWVSNGYSVEAKVGCKILKRMLGEWSNIRAMPSVTVIDVGLSADGNTITGVTGLSSDGTTLNITPRFVLDATDLGDLLPMANVEHYVGAESFDHTHEPDAPRDGVHPEWIQPFTYPIALERRPAGEDHTIPKPAGYETVRDSQGFTFKDGTINGMFKARPLPNNQDMGHDFWTYRRVIKAALFAPDARPFAGDVANINVDSNDYLADVIPSGDPARDAAALSAARKVSLCYIYWLQTECPRDPGDGFTTGYANLRPVTEFWDTPDAISPDPYIREGRRIQALTTVLEQDIAAKDGHNRDLQNGPRAQLFADSCGIGHYNIDIHTNHLGMTGLSLSTKPYQIPLGALVPVRVNNLLPACKNIGVTHITNGAYRLHPIEWNIGEAAGALAAFCIDQAVTPQTVAGDSGLILAMQRSLLAAGIPLFWWSDVPDTDPGFVAIHLLGIKGVFSGENELTFGPNQILTDGEKAALAERVASKSLTWPAGAITRSQAAILILNQTG